MKSDSLVIPVATLAVVAYAAACMALFPMSSALAANIALVALQASALAVVASTAKECIDAAFLPLFYAGNAACLLCQAVVGAALISVDIAYAAALILPVGAVLLAASAVCDAFAVSRASSLNAA